jgi:hypothetical protein
MRTSPTSEERLGLVRRHEIVNPLPGAEIPCLRARVRRQPPDSTPGLEAATRSEGPLITSEVLYQLSYVGKAFTVAESLRPDLASQRQIAEFCRVRSF